MPESQLFSHNENLAQIGSSELAVLEIDDYKIKIPFGGGGRATQPSSSYGGMEKLHGDPTVSPRPKV